MVSPQTPTMLPSIREMFPVEYLMRQPGVHTNSTASPRSYPYPPARTFHAKPRYTALATPAQQHRTVPVPCGSRAFATVVLGHQHPEPARASPAFSASCPRSIPANSPELSFDVHRSDPPSSSLQHTASGLTFDSYVRGAPSSSSPLEPYAPAFRVSAMPESRKPDSVESRPLTYFSFSVSGQSFHPSTTSPIGPEGDDVSLLNATRYKSPTSIDDPNGVSDGELSSTGKKHICPTCEKGFNRPSSLRIHANTHTGATPFRCPWPNCGREFNVNSNMRRHHRNHTAPGSASSSSSSSSDGSGIDHRRSLRRRRHLPHQGVVFIAGDSSVHAPLHCTTRPLSIQPRGSPACLHPRRHAAPPSLASSVEEASEPAELVDDGRPDHEFRRGPPIAPDDDLEARYSHLHRDAVPFQRYSQSHLRSAVAGSSLHTPWLSYFPGPHQSSSSPRQEICTPSPAYAGSALASSRVSPTLRPAFAPAGVKDEPSN